MFSKKPAFVLSCIILITNYLPATNIQGKVMDENNEPIEFANIVLYSLPDSTLLTGTTTDSLGNFIFDEVPATANLLKVSSIGYKTRWFSIPFPEKILLQPDTNLLEEVNVFANRKIYTLSHNGLVAEVKGTILETLSNASEILSELPFISVDNGNYMVFGKGKPLIYVNNRPLINESELKQLLPKNIKNIEIITTPGAEYDATVGAVIKITTERIEGEGLSGHINLEGSKSRCYSKNGSALLNYHIRAWDFFCGISFNNAKNEDYQNTFQEVNLTNKNYSETFDFKYSNNMLGVWPRFGINYNPNPRHSVGLQYTAEIFSIKTDIDNHITMDSIDNFTASEIISNNNVKTNEQNLNAYYNGKFTDNFSLNIYANVVTGHKQDMQNSYDTKTPDDTIKNNYEKEYTLGAGKIVCNYDFSHSTISFGSEYTYTNIFQKNNINRNNLGIDNSNDHSIQNRKSFFSTYRGKYGKTGIGAGIRYENIDMDYYQKGIFNKDQSQLYNKFFPDFSLSYETHNCQYQLAYSRTIQYPSYYQLRSSITYLSPYVYETGNPYLKPQIDNNFTAMFSWKDIQGMILYVINENKIEPVPDIYEDKNIVIYSIANLSKIRNFNALISYTPTFGFWKPILEININRQWLQINNINYEKPLFLMEWNNAFQLKNNWTLRLNIKGNSSGNSGIQFLEPCGRIDFKISKSFLNKKLNIYAAIIDIFHSYNQNYKTNYSNIRIKEIGDFDSRYAYIALYYNFNAFQNKYKGQNATDEINRLK
jgi:hypothetical protein